MDMYSQKNRADKEVTKGGERKVFFTGGNSSCRAHIHQHYKIYKEWCKEENILENHHAIPRPLWRKMEEDKWAIGKRQVKIDGMLEVQEPRLKQFTCDGALNAIVRFVTCDDQVCRMCDYSSIEMLMSKNRHLQWPKNLCSEMVSLQCGQPQYAKTYQACTTWVYISTMNL